MVRVPLKPPFRQLARWVTCLISVVGMTAVLLFGGIRFPGLMSPHSTAGGLMFLALLALALLIFLVLVYLVPTAAIELYQKPLTRTVPNLVAFIAGLGALILLATWLAGGIHVAR